MEEVRSFLAELERVRTEVTELRGKLSESSRLSPLKFQELLGAFSSLAWKAKIIENSLDKLELLGKAIHARVEEKIHREKSLGEILRLLKSLRGSSTVRAQAEQVLSALRNTTGAKRVLLLITSPELALHLGLSEIHHPEGDPLLEEKVLPLLKAISLPAETIAMMDASSEPKFQPLAGEDVFPLLLVPVVVAGNQWGILYLDKPSSTIPLEQCVELAEAISAALAMHLEIQRLSWEVSRFQDELARLQIIKEQEELEKDYIRAVFSRFVSPVIVERMASDPSVLRLGGKRQEISVLFADIRGFTALSEKMPPEKLVETLNQYLSLAADAILQEEGTLDKFIGDAVMAFFNAPYPQEDHVYRAARAALRIKKRIEELHSQDRFPVKLYFGIGINVGDAVVGNIGTSMQMNYTAIGDCVNVAKRLQEMADAGQILISANFYGRLGSKAIARVIPPLTIPGRSGRETVYELLDLLD